MKKSAETTQNVELFDTKLYISTIYPSIDLPFKSPLL